MIHMSARTTRCQPHGAPSQWTLKFDSAISKARFGKHRKEKEKKEKEKEKCFLLYSHLLIRDDLVARAPDALPVCINNAKRAVDLPQHRFPNFPAQK